MTYEKKYLKYKKKYLELKKLEEQILKNGPQNAGDGNEEESNPFNMLSQVLIGSTLDKLKNRNQ
jgi:hypothetical protein